MTVVMSAWTIAEIPKLDTSLPATLQTEYRALNWSNAIFWTGGAFFQLLSMFNIPMAAQLNLMYWFRVSIVFMVFDAWVKLYMWYLYDGYKTTCNGNSAAAECATAAQMEEDNAYALSAEAITATMIMSLYDDWLAGQWDMLPAET